MNNAEDGTLELPDASRRAGTWEQANCDTGSRGKRLGSGVRIRLLGDGLRFAEPLLLDSVEADCLGFHEIAQVARDCGFRDEAEYQSWRESHDLAGQELGADS